MTSGSFRFDEFTLDSANRQLRQGGRPVELNARYLDALSLLVREAGRLVSKDRFLEEVWRGVPVTDEALTQCIRTLRRRLGDDASRPRFIETVPKHGYRFVADVEPAGTTQVIPKHRTHVARRAVRIGLAGMAGGGIAGLVGGVIYGMASTTPASGAVSGLLVIVCVTAIVGMLGGAGVALGMGAADSPGRPWQLSVLGAALGGLLMGAIVKLLGMDGFTLLLGRAPADITGAFEGALLGAGVGFGMGRSGRLHSASLRRKTALGAACGAAAGLLITLLGGRLMAGSLQELAHAFPGSRLRIDRIGAWFGENGFGPVSQVGTGILEGALFGGCMVAALVLARREKK